MDTFKFDLENYTNKIFEAFDVVAASARFRSDFSVYSTHLREIMKRYEHHQGVQITHELLENRFKREAALLHVVSRLLAANSEHLDLESWPIYDRNSPYGWLRDIPLTPLPSDFHAHLATRDENAIPQLIDACTYYLDSTTDRFLGEFYTPLPIAKHLIELSGYDSRSVIDEKRAIDPACGGGIILWLIMRCVLETLIQEGKQIGFAIDLINRTIYGYDVQPFAIVITRTILFHQLGQFFTIRKLNSANVFKNIRLQDALATGEFSAEANSSMTIDNESFKFDYIIGNPPFMSAKGCKLDFIDKYKEVIYGHPNLYQLFLWWAIKHLKVEGIVSFLVPQSMLSGIYFKNLRAQVNANTSIKSITRITNTKDIVKNADLQMMAITLALAENNFTQRQPVTVRTVKNAFDLNGAPPFQVSYDQLVKKVAKAPSFWIISDSSMDYEISETVAEQCTVIGEHSNTIEIRIGNFVWNQHKDLVVKNYASDHLPLISAASISVFGFQFPYAGPHPANRRPFVKRVDRIKDKALSGQTVLLQRTPPRKHGRRIVASILPIHFAQQYDKYLLENHVIYFQEKSEVQDALFGWLGWLNSDLINFLFHLRNGSNVVSIHELKLLPVHLGLVEFLTVTSKQTANASTDQRQALIREINRCVYDQLGLSHQQQERIAAVLD